MNTTKARWGLLLINLGTPDAPTTGDVRRYLDEFLSDPRVLDIPAPIRWMLLNFVILPRRPAQSAAAYRTVWTDRGSPLMFHTTDLADGVRAKLGADVQVEVAMRYQNPSIASALRRLADAGVDRIVVFPLFPQYSSAATGSAAEKVMVEASKLWNVPALTFVDAFYEHPLFIEAFAQVAQPVLDELQPDHVMLSYHGLPERHCTKSDPTGAHCLKRADCCDAIVEANRNCYRAQCFATSRALKARLRLDDANTVVTFQSRLGRDPWVRPYTDEVLVELAKAGAKRLAVLCPAFVADCLETLEEIGERAAHDFKAAGGQELRLVPSLNSTQPWVDAVVAMARAHAPAAWTSHAG